MVDTVGEHGFHTLEVKSQSDDLKGDDVTVHYVRGDTKIAGNTQLGVEEGATMIFVTDFEDKQIGPGLWRFEFTRSDSGVTRQVGIEGESRNQRVVQVTDAETI
jgi:hypothetical protein